MDSSCNITGILVLQSSLFFSDNNKLTSIQEHILCCHYSPSFKEFSILTRESNGFKLTIIERLLIARDKPVLNKAYSSLLLQLFWYNIIGFHMMPIYPIVCIKLWFVQFLILCYQFYDFIKNNLWAFNIT